MSVMLVPFWNGLVFTLGAALSNSTRERPCASLPVTTRRMGLGASLIGFGLSGVRANPVRRSAPRFVGDRVHVGHDVDDRWPFHRVGPLEHIAEATRGPCAVKTRG